MNKCQTYCCASYAGKAEENLAATLYDLTATWYAEHPIAAGCSQNEVKNHQKKCQKAVRAEYLARRDEIHEACGFFEPVTIISIILTIIRLFYDWTHGRT